MTTIIVREHSHPRRASRRRNETEKLLLLRTEGCLLPEITKAGQIRNVHGLWTCTFNAYDSLSDRSTNWQAMVATPLVGNVGPISIRYNYGAPSRGRSRVYPDSLEAMSKSVEHP